jgi:hypothetical protein
MRPAMTAAEALHNLATDLAELEKRGSVRSGYIAARRREHQTIAKELATLQAEVQHLKKACNDELERNIETDLRLGMLANVLIILGFDPMVHLRRPITGGTYTNPDVYQLAAQQVVENDRAQGISHIMHLWRHRHIHVQHLKSLLDHALWHARLTIMLQPFNSLIHAKKEERRAA